MKTSSPKLRTIAVDIDGVLTNETTGHDYQIRTPNLSNIEKVNGLYNKGHTIVLYTARFHQDRHITEQWLKKFNVQYHKLVTDKLQYDVLIDDRAQSNFHNLE